MITRQDYISISHLPNASEFHRKYYAQFVTNEVKDAVEARFGIDALIESYIGCKHFNTIPLNQWDSLIAIQKDAVDHSLLKKAGEGWSLSSATCIFKEAARQLVETKIN